MGAQGFLLKSTPPSVMMDAIRSAAIGVGVLSEELLRELTPPLPETSGRIVLSEGELSVLRLLVDGLSNAEIAHKLHWSESTVKARLASASVRLGTRSRVSTAVRAVQRGLV